MNNLPQTTCPDGHPLFRCVLCELVFEEGHADPLPGGIRRCPQCLMGETAEYFGPFIAAETITHDSQFL